MIPAPFNVRLIPPPVSSSQDVALTIMDPCSLVQAICTRFPLGGALDVVIVGIGSAVAASFKSVSAWYHLGPQALSMTTEILVFWISFFAHRGLVTCKALFSASLSSLCLKALTLPPERQSTKKCCAEVCLTARGVSEGSISTGGFLTV